MDRAARKAATAAYKEQPSAWGVFVIRSADGAKRWVGQSRSLDTHRNGLWFALRHGRYPNRDLQAAFSDSGEAQFAFEVLERLPADTPPYSRARLSKERVDAWRAELAAAAV